MQGIAGDGQVTLDKTIVKHGARKVREFAGGKVRPVSPARPPTA